MQKIQTNDVKDRLFAGLQCMLPHHGLSRLMGLLGNCQAAAIKNLLIRWWIDHYKIDMGEAARSEVEQYASFNDFFTRALKPEARMFPDDNSIITSPADGTISQQGVITADQIIQAKGFHFSVAELLGGDQALAESFEDGLFSTIYLAPGDYHRVHMPCTGTLRQMIYIPGRLFSVNSTTTRHVPRLFARNERIVCVFDTKVGTMALVLVGAMIVASIETVWAHEVTPPRRQLKVTSYQKQPPVKLNRGDEMGRFKLGSTVIALFGRNAISWNEATGTGDTIQLGQSLACPVKENP